MSREKNEIGVTPVQHWLGTLRERWPKLFVCLGNLETKTLQEQLQDICIKQPIYIAGLARAGSTILLECLSRHPETATHRYRDNPLIHIPFWWNWFVDRAGQTDSVALERFHRDRIFVTPESPEAMEEVLWMDFFPTSHSPEVSNVLDSQTKNPTFEDFYMNHIRKVLLARRARRYLAKNNYNISRLRYLKALFPDACFIIPVRDPIEHVASLGKQHILLCEKENADPRVLEYMRNTGHFEFGLDRRPQNFGDQTVVDKILRHWKSEDDVQGLACQWNSAYSFVLDQIAQDDELGRASLLINYRDLCKAPEKVLNLVYRHCGLPADEEFITQQASCISAPTYYTISFSDHEIELINRETERTHKRILELALV
jgi:hypothetical protein